MSAHSWRFSTCGEGCCLNIDFVNENIRATVKLDDEAKIVFVQELVAFVKKSAAKVVAS